jgi:2,4-dienoyl-CoA reductase-like NADH-dependent reductase (Old Yellow Enzyme family)
LAHGGSHVRPEFSGGFRPVAPTSFSSEVVELSNPAIEELIQQFTKSAFFAQQAGADGVQLHGAHGYLLSAFMSPALNHRKDKWGGSPENRLRIISEIVGEIRKIVSDEFTIGIKMNCNDYANGGVTPEIAALHVRLLSNKIDLFELSGGFEGKWSIRSTVNEKVIGKGVAEKERAELFEKVRKLMNGVKFEESSFRDAARVIRAGNPEAKIAVVGGNRPFGEDVRNEQQTLRITHCKDDHTFFD